MPWTSNRFPVSMRKLPPGMRGKAIEIANALLRAGRPEGQAIRIAISSARRWCASHTAHAMRARLRRWQ